MERIHLISRIVVTVILLTTMGELTDHLGSRLAQYTAPRPDTVPSLTVQSRRTVMDRIAEGRLLSQSDPVRAEAILMQVVRDARDPEMRSRASLLLVQIAEHSWPADHRRDFLRQIGEAALNSARLHKIPPSVIMAQAALESGWGRSQLARDHHNLFGIKATRSQKAAQFNTLEVGKKGAHIVRARFRSFASVEHSIVHHGELLSSDARYASTRSAGQNWRAFVAEMAPVYATDPAYAARITQIIERYRLDRWDHINVGSHRAIQT